MYVNCIYIFMHLGQISNAGVNAQIKSDHANHLAFKTHSVRCNVHQSAITLNPQGWDVSMGGS